MGEEGRYGLEGWHAAGAEAGKRQGWPPPMQTKGRGCVHRGLLTTGALMGSAKERSRSGSGQRQADCRQLKGPQLPCSPSGVVALARGWHMVRGMWVPWQEMGGPREPGL